MTENTMLPHRGLHLVNVDVFWSTFALKEGSDYDDYDLTNLQYPDICVEFLSGKAFEQLWKQCSEKLLA